jgi:hypothetical protein
MNDRTKKLDDAYRSSRFDDCQTLDDYAAKVIARYITAYGRTEAAAVLLDDAKRKADGEER